MKKKREIVKSREELIELIAKGLSLDGAKKKDLRKTIAELVKVDAEANSKGMRGPIVMLRKESLLKSPWKYR